jgi:hypothetical protein
MFMNKKIITLLQDDLDIKVKTIIALLLQEFKRTQSIICDNGLTGFEDIHEEITEFVHMLDVVQDDPFENERTIDRLEKLRKEILSKGEELSSYEFYINKIENDIEYNIYLKNHDTNPQFDTHLFSDMCDKLRETIKDGLKCNEMAEIISILPVKMSKHTYEQYIKKTIGLYGESKHFVDSFVKKCKERFLPEINEYRVEELYIRDVFDGINEMKALDFEKYNVEELEQYQMSLLGITALYYDRWDMVDSLITITTSLLTIFYMLKDETIELLQNDYLYKDMFFCIKEMKNDKDEILKEQEEEILNELCEELISEFSVNFNKAILLTNNSDNVDELQNYNDYKAKYYSCTLLDSIFRSGIDNSLYEESFKFQFLEQELASDKYIDTKIQELFEHISRKMDSINIKEKRYARRNFMYMTVRTMESQEFLDYIKNAYEDIIDDNIKQEVDFRIMKLLTKQGFYNDIYEDDEE